ncbi:hypothetical protein PROFUN_12673 [Planoprotostelium fungivorum]|uniref:Uncharacterized protein n=1 Tax=Planoprotostelium fungivorum TaxID=1890364 RepID=A0A2P6N711_9EUKA|nr:hypothetical protein PROFUN_12673 [Planoprotostelium fungivorum]
MLVEYTNQHEGRDVMQNPDYAPCWLWFGIFRWTLFEWRNRSAHITETMDATNIKAGDSTKATADEKTEAVEKGVTVTEINSGVTSFSFGESGATAPSSATQLGVWLSITPILLALFI